MSTPSQQCVSCKKLIDPNQEFCHYCGTENNINKYSAAKAADVILAQKLGMMIYSYKFLESKVPENRYEWFGGSTAGTNDPDNIDFLISMKIAIDTGDLTEIRKCFDYEIAKNYDDKPQNYGNFWCCYDAKNGMTSCGCRARRLKDGLKLLGRWSTENEHWDLLELSYLEVDATAIREILKKKGDDVFNEITKRLDEKSS